MVDRIVADTGPLIALARLHQLALPAAVFRQVWLPSLVLDECCADSAYPEGGRITAAVSAGWLVVADAPPPPDRFGLDAGEAAAITLARARQAGVLMDDQAGRRVAARLGLPVIGVLGLLILGKRVGQLPAVRPLAEQLLASGYYLGAPLTEHACHLAGE